MIQGNKILKYVNLYLIFTIIYYFTGRYSWNIPSDPKLIFYFIIIIISLNIGYILKMGIPRVNSNTRNKMDIKYKYEKISFSKNTNILFIVSCISIIFFQVMWVQTVLGKFDVFDAFSNIGQNYYERLDFSTGNNKVFSMQIRTLLWGLTLYAYPIGFYFFKQLTWRGKLLLFITILVDSLVSLNMGISKNIGDITLVFILCMLIQKKYRLNSFGHLRKINKKWKIMLTVTLFFSMFYIIQMMRDSATNISYSKAFNPYGSFADVRNFTFYDTIFGNTAITSLIDKIGVYVSHGYTGLAYALELPFNNTYGLGFSRALIEYADQYLGTSLQTQTYPAMIEQVYGWPNGIYWPSAFTWFASAVTFFGLPIIMMIYGWVLASVEKRFKKFQDVFSLALLTQLFIMALYLPANAQIFQSRASLFGTIFVSIAYILTRRRVKRSEASK
ncbi:hypothetical protein DN399_25955 [Bacillus sp. AR4-2]|nr:hypothetical protein DN399_25955 [Bacillus sp. AR4-2]QEL76630.1 hypothetical protein DN405_25955 [Bacillus sp. SH8-8]